MQQPDGLINLNEARLSQVRRVPVNTGKRPTLNSKWQLLVSDSFINRITRLCIREEISEVRRVTASYGINNSIAAHFLRNQARLYRRQMPPSLQLRLQLYLSL